MKPAFFPALTLGLAGLVLASCQSVCETDADCTGEQTCFLNRCTNPASKNPADFGDGCEPGSHRCTYEGTPSGAVGVLERCGVDDAGESKWEQHEVCSLDQYCDAEVGACAAPLAANEACGHLGKPCTPGYRCSTVPELSPRCLPACGAGRECESTELCAYGTCIPAGLCAGCARGQTRCSGSTAQVCVVADDECTQWQDELTCGGSDRCEGGGCVGTVSEGGACAPDANCLPGLLCLEDVGVCSETCRSSTECGGQRCLVTPGSRQRGVCTDAGGVAIDQICFVVIESATARGRWDQVARTGREHADLAVSLVGPEYRFSTSVVEDSEVANFGVSSTPVDFGTLVQVDVVVVDSDLVGSDFVGRWALREGFDWRTGQTWSLTFGDEARGVQLRVDCSM